MSNNDTFIRFLFSLYVSLVVSLIAILLLYDDVIKDIRINNNNNNNDSDIERLITKEKGLNEYEVISLEESNRMKKIKIEKDKQERGIEIFSLTEYED